MSDDVARNCHKSGGRSGLRERRLDAGSQFLGHALDGVAGAHGHGNGVTVDDDILDGFKFRKRQVEYWIKHCTCNLLHLFFGQHGIVFFLNGGDKRFHSPSPVA